MFAVQSTKRRTNKRISYNDYKLSPMQATFLSLFEEVSDGRWKLSQEVAFSKYQCTVGSCWERELVVIDSIGNFERTKKGTDALRYYGNADIDRVSRAGWSSRIKWGRAKAKIKKVG